MLQKCKKNRHTYTSDIYIFGCRPASLINILDCSLNQYRIGVTIYRPYINPSITKNIHYCDKFHFRRILKSIHKRIRNFFVKNYIVFTIYSPL